MDIADRLATKTRRAGLRVNRPIAESELARFEAESGVAIPADYRAFLLNVANGGKEPCRLVPLAGWCWCYWIEHPKPKMAAEPCVITPDAYHQGEHWLEKAKVPDWESRWDRNEWDPMFGTIAIAEIGCGLFFSMIMTGPFRGRIFSWGDHALNPPYVYPEGSFAEWFEKCLDAIVAGEPVHFLDGRIR
ncbi:MAG: SMI1/KNR4 family protein [Deltaproteobacteria bacterium]|nr:SMI1/KNR4 family protein [Deltaproteobacteria bacterium]